MTKSVRWPFGLLNRRKHQKDVIQGISELGNANMGAAQIGSYACLSNNISSGAAYSSGNQQLNIRNTCGLAETVDHFKQNDGRVSLYDANSFSAKNDLMPNYFVSHSESPSLKARFGRSCRAFVNAWRAA